MVFIIGVHYYLSYFILVDFSCVLTSHAIRCIFSSILKYYIIRYSLPSVLSLHIFFPLYCMCDRHASFFLQLQTMILIFMYIYIFLNHPYYQKYPFLMHQYMTHSTDMLPSRDDYPKHMEQSYL